MMKPAIVLALLILPVLRAADPPAQTPQLPPALQGIGIEQRLDAPVPLDTPFLDELGRPVKLRDYVGSRPAILALVYYRCTMLCSYILNGVVSALRPLSLEPGRDFDVIAISIDPQDDPATALAKRDRYVRSYSKRASPEGWHFLTGREPDIRSVADAVGFHYRYDPKTQLFLHASGIMVLTPEGRISRYFYGVDFAPKDLKLGLVEASNNRIGSPADRILLFCLKYDPSTGKYGAAVMNLLRAGSAAVLLALVVCLTIFWRRDIHAARALHRKSIP